MYEIDTADSNCGSRQTQSNVLQGKTIWISVAMTTRTLHWLSAVHYSKTLYESFAVNNLKPNLKLRWISSCTQKTDADFRERTFQLYKRVQTSDFHAVITLWVLCAANKTQMSLVGYDLGTFITMIRNLFALNELAHTNWLYCNDNKDSDYELMHLSQ